MSPTTHLHATPAPTTGAVLNWGWRYDLLTSTLDVLLGGRLRQIRQYVLDLARLTHGASVLDVGCGTGTLALEAYQRVGPAGRVAGIDPGPRQIGRAQAKAARRGLPIDFQIGVIERLPFLDASFDAVLSTLMMHHLPEELKREGLAEVARVLKPGGRLVIADAEHPHLHPLAPRQHGKHASADSLQGLIEAAGLSTSDVSQIQVTRLPVIPKVAVTVAQKAALQH